MAPADYTESRRRDRRILPRGGGPSLISVLSATDLIPTYTISGVIVDGVDAGIEGVTVTLGEDGEGITTQTNSSGEYSFSGLQSGWTYSVEPSFEGYTFTPAGEIVFEWIEGDIEADFVGEQVNPMLPVTFVWAEGTTPNSNADWGNGTIGAPSTVANSAVSTLSSWNPYTGGFAAAPALSNRQVSFRGSADTWTMWKYNKWNSDGLVLDISKGIRVQYLIGTALAPFRQYFWIELGNNAMSDAILFYGDMDTANGTGFREFVSSVNQSLRADTAAGTGEASQSWLAASLDFPAGGTGNVTVKIKTFIDSAAAENYSEAIPLQTDWSAKTLDSLQIGSYYRSQTPGYGGDLLLNYVWVGTGTDAWPI